MKILVTSLNSVDSIKPFQSEGMESLICVVDNTLVYVDGLFEWFESVFLPNYVPSESIHAFLKVAGNYVGSDLNSTYNKLKLTNPEVDDSQILRDASILFAVAMQFIDSSGSKTYKYTGESLKLVGSVADIVDIGSLLADAGAQSPPL